MSFRQMEIHVPDADCLSSESEFLKQHLLHHLNGINEVTLNVRTGKLCFLKEAWVQKLVRLEAKGFEDGRDFDDEKLLALKNLHSIEMPGLLTAISVRGLKNLIAEWQSGRRDIGTMHFQVENRGRIQRLLHLVHDKECNGERCPFRRKFMPGTLILKINFPNARNFHIQDVSLQAAS